MVSFIKKFITNHPLNVILFIGFIFLAVSTCPSTSWAQGSDIDIPLEGLTGDFDIDDEWDEYDDSLVDDPYKKYNKFMFNINDKIYRNVFTPLAKGYDFLIPRRAQSSLNNVILFASTPKRFFNNLFQKKPKAAFIEFERLLINATLGIGGLFDPADRIFHLKRHSEDFGQTLAHYGAGAGPYFIWPIIGPSTRRDTIGTVIDNAFSPFFWFAIYDVEPEDGFRAFIATKRVNNYSYTVRDGYKRITDNAIDPYIALRNAYIQNRNKNIKK